MKRMMDSMMTRADRRRRGGIRRGVSLIEVLAVLAVMGIAGGLVSFVSTNSDGMQAQMAADSVTSWLIYAQNVAITHQRSVRVVFDTGDDSIQLEDSDGAVLTGNVAADDGRYRMVLPMERGMGRVQIGSVSFDGEVSVWFDSFGAPHGGAITALPPTLLNGQVVITAGDASMTIQVEPLTGEVHLL